MSVSPSPSITKDDLMKIDDELNKHTTNNNTTTTLGMNQQVGSSQESLSAREAVKLKHLEDEERFRKGGRVGDHQHEVNEGDVIAEGEET